MSTNPQILFTHISAMVERSPRLSLEDCSHLLRLSPRSIQQAVHAATGASFRALQERALLAEAERLLTSYPPLSIKEIAIATGYKSARSFSRAVRRSCGLSPREFRAFLLKEQLKAQFSPGNSAVVAGL